MKDNVDKVQKTIGRAMTIASVKEHFKLSLRETNGPEGTVFTKENQMFSLPVYMQRDEQADRKCQYYRSFARLTKLSF